MLLEEFASNSGESQLYDKGSHHGAVGAVVEVFAFNQSASVGLHLPAHPFSFAKNTQKIST
jgi:hypothetical protein